jgi:hypothetical protein
MSNSFRKFDSRLTECDSLYKRRKNPDVIFIHAALASYFSTWESFLEDISREYCTLYRTLLHRDAANLSAIFQNSYEEAIERFNTPNFENAVRLINRTTGCDLSAIWTAIGARGNPAFDSKIYLNDALDVRHSFAHGFGLPSNSFTNRQGIGRPVLGKADVIKLRAFLMEMALQSSNTLGDFFSTSFGKAKPW